MKAIPMYMFLLIEAIQGKGKCIMIEAEEERTTNTSRRKFNSRNLWICRGITSLGEDCWELN
jgi:hypothetical protein